MNDIREYGEDDFEDEIPDEDDEIRQQILEAEANEVWLEEPGDDEDGPAAGMNPLFGMFSGAGFPGMFPGQIKKEKTDDEDPEL